MTNTFTLGRSKENLTVTPSDSSNHPTALKRSTDKKGCCMIKVENLEDERLLFSIISKEIPKRVQNIIYDAIEEFEERRSI